MSALRTPLAWWATGVVLALAAAGTYVAVRRGDRLPPPDSPAYEEVVRRFYRGLATLEVGLLDDAKREFTQATMVVPNEPASWANLGLAHLRLGDFDGAAQAIQKAVALAPSSSEIAFLEGQLEKSRGRQDAAVASLRRAIQIDAGDLRARYALAQEIENAGGPTANDEADRLLQDLGRRRPDNLAVLLERTRLSAKRGDRARLQEAVGALARDAPSWPAAVREQVAALQSAAAAGNFADAVRATAFVRNLLVRLPAFREGLVEIKPPSELIADPFRRFLKLPTPGAAPAAADEALTFASEPLIVDRPEPVDSLIAVSLDGSASPTVFVAGTSTLRRLTDAADVLPFPGDRAPGSSAAVAALDWNRDFKMDFALAGARGIKLMTQVDEKGVVPLFREAQPEKGVRPLFEGDCFGVWAADLEMDGDLDLIVGVNGVAPVALRNNGDGTWTRQQPFPGVVGLRAFAWADLDGDGDPDAALLDAAGGLHLFENRQAGEFRPMQVPSGATNILAMTLGDVDADGWFDVITLDTNGAIRRLSYGAAGGWQERQIAVWMDRPAGGSPGTYRLILADLDNNGALDLIASGGGRSRVWLADARIAFHPMTASLDADVSDAADLNGDGLLDLLGVAAGEPRRFIARGRAGYHWQVVRPRAQPTAGDQRINSFGVGGNVEIRSGLLTVKQPIVGPVVHFGLGTRTEVEVTRIVWPNGIMQADFDRRADETILTEQRLKGSCPWVFADDGTGMRFVTDFLWRSPLGLRINAQDTAGVTQTEDWVKIRGDQLAVRNGSYDVRITAELWETHFIDQVALMVVDHPSDTEVFVDERFAKTAPALTTYVTGTPTPVARAWDDSGHDVTDLVSRQDGRYLATFALGEYQGIAADHFVEVDLGREIPRDQRLWLIANGWIYPTDSSINVAIGQGQRVEPRGLSLEAQDRSGRWIVVSPDLGFPAGKNKTMLIDLSRVTAAGVAHARRLRLRTNLEVYWDYLAVAPAIDRVEPGSGFKTSECSADLPPPREASADRRSLGEGGQVRPTPAGLKARTTGFETVCSVIRVSTEKAELRYRGFSETDHADRRRPEIPLYERLANVTERWRDLVGYYTRFGDVRELVAGVDDRYVIMNAGDELRMSFRAPAAPAPGWKRDFVLAGDGWEKDGDYNTTFSKTVGPLPTHARADYGASPLVELEDDPVYRRFPRDWQTYHTRFVAPDDFLRGLR